jgi:hypothetical protein
VDAVSKLTIPGGETLFARAGIAAGAVVVGDTPNLARLSLTFSQ